jgi:hypothetical protein
MASSSAAHRCRGGKNEISWDLNAAMSAFKLPARLGDKRRIFTKFGLAPRT